MNTRHNYWSWVILASMIFSLVWLTGPSEGKAAVPDSQSEMANPANRPAFLSWPLPGDIPTANISRYPNSAWTWTFLGMNPSYECPAYPAALYDPPENVNVWRNAELPEAEDAAQADRNGNGWIDCYGHTDPAGGHVGTDITAADWTPVYAAADGWVNAVVPDNGDYNYVRIKHEVDGEWWFTRYLHIQNTMLVSDGDYVTAGQQIGYVGSSHLHFELGTGTTHYYAVSVNPWGRDNDPWDGCMWANQGLCQSVAPPSLVPAGQNIVLNSSFDSGIEHWWTWGELDYAFYGPTLYFKRRADSPTGAAVGQDWSYTVPASSPFEITLKLGNTSSVVKTPGIHLRFGGEWDIQCYFSVPPNTPLQTYIVRGRSGASERHSIKLEVWPDPPDGIPDLMMDDVSVMYRPDTNPNGTECIYPDSTYPDGYVELPEDGSSLDEYVTSVDFTAQAWDNDGGSGVQQVEFYVNYDAQWHLVGTDTEAPYAVAWAIPADLAAQELIFTVHVIDRAGNRTMDPGGNHYVQYSPCTDCGLSDSAWPTLRGNLKRTGQSILAGPLRPILDWDFAGQDYSTAPTIASDGAVYTALGDTLYAFAPDGQVVWSYTHPSGGKFSTSAVLTKRGDIYIGSDDGALYALDSLGNLRWSYLTGGWMNSSPAVAPNGTIYFGSSDAQMRALSPTGQLKWSYTVGSWIQSSPAVGDDGTIYFGSTDWHVYALNPDGTLKWSTPTEGYVDNSPAISADGMTLYIGSIDGYLYALNTQDGSLKWRQMTSGHIGWASPAVASDGTVYASTEDVIDDGVSEANLYAFSPNGDLKWMHTFSENVNCSPTLDSRGVLFIGSTDGKLYAVDPQDGDILWSIYLGGWLNYNPVIGANGTIYVSAWWPAHLYAIQEAYVTFLPIIKR